MADDINLTINKLYLYVPNLLPSVETQIMFNETTQNNYNKSHKEFYTARRVKSDQIFQKDFGSAQQVSSSEYLIGAHQTRLKTEIPNKNNNIAIFDNLDLGKNYVQIDSRRYPTDSVLINYEENGHIQQYKDLKLFFKEYIGEPFIKSFYSISRHENKIPYRNIRFKTTI